MGLTAKQGLDGRPCRLVHPPRPPCGSIEPLVSARHTVLCGTDSGLSWRAVSGERCEWAIARHRRWAGRGSLPSEQARHSAWSWGAVRVKEESGGQVSWVLKPLLGPTTAGARAPQACLIQAWDGGRVSQPGGRGPGRTADSRRESWLVSPRPRLKVRRAGPGRAAPSLPSIALSPAGGCAGQALFSGLKIKASWPAPCWQRGRGGGRAPG